MPRLTMSTPFMSYGIDFADIDKTNYSASGDHFATQLDAAESAAIDDGWTLDTTSPVSSNTPNSLPPWHLRSAADNGWPRTICSTSAWRI